VRIDAQAAAHIDGPLYLHLSVVSLTPSTPAFAEDAARACGLNPSDVTVVRRAALVHDLGRLGVSNSIWDKQAALSHSELERVRLHPYLTERMLESSTTLAPLARIAVQHHERLDGSGYPRGLSGDSLSIAGRLLAAADVYHASLEPRPHRGARSPDDATTELRTEVRSSTAGWRRG
jgi:HD-GYP domain-containing protein (c-di-GMP phosphodiesterase class II)